MTRLVRNAIQTPDGTVLESRHCHDYVTHQDRITGETYMIDGGLEYIRSSVNTVPATNLSVCLEDGIEMVRDVVTWGTYGKDGKQPFRRIALRDMSNGHIQACLDMCPNMHPNISEAFKMELQYRKEQGIIVED